MKKFGVPEILSTTNCWGPPSEHVPERFKEIKDIFATFKKSETLGAIGDFTTSNNYYHKKREGNRHGNEALNYQAELYDDFSTVDTTGKKSTKRGWYKKSYRRNNLSKGKKDTFVAEKKGRNTG